jgi:hypothetical protein
MNIYRLYRLDADKGILPAGAIVDAIVVAPDIATARALISIEEHANRDLARSWLSTRRLGSVTSIIEIGVTSQDYDDQLVNGDDDPHVLVVSRVGEKGPENR